jgi:hypothetical protein
MENCALSNKATLLFKIIQAEGRSPAGAVAQMCSRADSHGITVLP